MTETVEKRGPACPPKARAEEEKVERRRRKSTGMDRHLKLSVPEHLKEPGYVYRFAADRPGRIQQLYAEDWDVVGENRDGPKIEPRRFGGVNDKGEAQEAVLCKKRVEFHEEDRREKQRPLDEIEDDLRRGPAAGANSLGTEAAETHYVPGGRNTIGRD